MNGVVNVVGGGNDINGLSNVDNDGDDMFDGNSDAYDVNGVGFTADDSNNVVVVVDEDDDDDDDVYGVGIVDDDAKV